MNLEMIWAIERIHQTVDAMAKQAQIEAKQMHFRALCKIRLTASWHTRSLGQIRRYEAARTTQGEIK
ncbi:MAG: hypothetical protein PHP57_13860 [Sideroxydans sp.]|nr:hypothetical protein [Sideroxydans sp.]